MAPVATRCTSRSNVSGPGGAEICAGFHLNAGCAVSITKPAGLLKEVRVAHAGTMIGPITPLVAVSPLAAVASTRQNSDPVLNAWGVANVCAVMSLSTIGVASALSRPMRRRYVTGVAKTGTVPTVHENVGVIVVSGPAAGSGAVTVTPPGKTAAAVTSGRPQP